MHTNEQQRRIHAAPHDCPHFLSSLVVEVDTHRLTSTTRRVKGHTHNSPGGPLNPHPASLV